MGKPKQITKKDLIDSAKRQLVSKGQSRITLKNVAEAAGVTQGVVYYHFKTKDQLLLSLLQNFMDELNHELMEWKEDKGDTLTKFLSEEQYRIQIKSEQPQLLIELGSLALHHKELRAAMSKGLQQRAGVITELVGGDERIGRMVTALVDGLAFQSLFDPTLDEKGIYDVIHEWLVKKKVE